VKTQVSRHTQNDVGDKNGISFSEFSANANSKIQNKKQENTILLTIGLKVTQLIVIVEVFIFVAFQQGACLNILLFGFEYE